MTKSEIYDFFPYLTQQNKKLKIEGFKKKHTQKVIF